MRKILIAILIPLGLIGDVGADTRPNVIYILADDLGGSFRTHLERGLG